MYPSGRWEGFWVQEVYGQEPQVVVTMPLLFLGTALVYRDFFIVPTAVPVLDTPAPVPPASIVPDQPSAVYPSPAPTIVPEVAPEQPGLS